VLFVCQPFGFDGKCVRSWTQWRVLVKQWPTLRIMSRCPRSVYQALCWVPCRRTWNHSIIPTTLFLTIMIIRLDFACQYWLSKKWLLLLSSESTDFHNIERYLLKGFHFFSQRPNERKGSTFLEKEEKICSWENEKKVMNWTFSLEILLIIKY